MQAAFPSILGPREEVPSDLTGRTALVTGGANGIGYEVSRAFAKAGAKVIMVNRKEEQGDDAIQHIKAEKPDAQVEWVGCDLGKLSEVKAVFSKIAQEQDRLDLLIISAGINADQQAPDADGIDRHFGVNWLGNWLALNQLLPLIRKTSRTATEPARIVFISSEQHRMAPNNMHFASFEEVSPETGVGSNAAYGRTKAAQILGSKYLLENHLKPNGEDDKIYTLAVHPGDVLTNMQNSWKTAYPGVFGQILSVANKALGRTIEQGSYSTIYAACSPEIIEKKWNGWYFSDPGTEGKESAQASDPLLGIALWELSTRLVEDKLGKDALVDWNATKE